MVASLVAAYHRVPIDKLVQGFPRSILPKEKDALMQMYKSIQQFQSRLGKEGSMLEPMWNFSTKTMKQGIDGALKVGEEILSGAKHLGKQTPHYKGYKWLRDHDTTKDIVREMRQWQK